MYHIIIKASPMFIAKHGFKVEPQKLWKLLRCLLLEKGLRVGPMFNKIIQPIFIISLPPLTHPLRPSLSPHRSFLPPFFSHPTTGATHPMAAVLHLHRAAPPCHRPSQPNSVAVTLPRGGGNNNDLVRSERGESQIFIPCGQTTSL